MKRVRDEAPPGLVLYTADAKRPLLGQGAHSRVHRGSFYRTDVAVKQYRRAALDTFKREFAFYDRVSRLQLAHPGLLAFLGAFKRDFNHTSS